MDVRSSARFWRGLPAAARALCLSVGCLIVCTGGSLALASSAAASGEELPPVEVQYTGSLEDVEMINSSEGASKTTTKMHWQATGFSTGLAVPGPLAFSELGGEVNAVAACGTGHQSLSLNPEENPIGNDWTLSESASFPAAGWLYEASDTPNVLPGLWTTTALECGQPPAPGTPTRSQAQFGASELYGYSLGNDAPGGEQKAHELLEEIKFHPGQTASQTRTFEVTYPLAEGSTAKLTLNLTVNVSAASVNNAITSPPTKRAPLEPPTKETSEQRRREIKEQAKADLGPALEETWKAHGLSTLLGLGGGLVLSQVADELGSPAAAFGGNDAEVRVLNDLRIKKDPPAPGYLTLANPPTRRPPALPSCHRFHAGAARYCKALRFNAIEMLDHGGVVAAIDEAMSTTIDRDTAAIDAGDYVAAEQQARHFEALRSSMSADLSAEASAGAQVAKLLRQAHINTTLSKAQSKRAIGWLEGKLDKAGFVTASISSLAGGALTPRKVNALQGLTDPAG